MLEMRKLLAPAALPGVTLSPLSHAAAETFDLQQDGSLTSISAIAARLLQAADNALASNGASVRASLREVLASVERAQLDHSDDSTLPSWRANRLLAFIRDNLTRQITIQDMSTHLGMSRGHLSRVFKRRFGMAPRKYVNWRRVIQAQELMLLTDESLVAIALRCGMCDQSHFTRTFHRLVGQPPGRWRDRHRRDPSADRGTATRIGPVSSHDQT